MKRISLLLAFFIVISLCFSTAGLSWKPIENDTAYSFVFPDSLELIEDEAFESTAPKAVILSDSVVKIGQRAFAYSLDLKTVTIPESVIYIGEQAFEGIPELVVRGSENSYAAQWAFEHEICFIPLDSAAAWVETLIKLLAGSVFTLLPVCIWPEETSLRRRKTLDVWRSMRPQDRPELYPINYKFP